MVTLNNGSLPIMSEEDKPRFRRTVKTVKSRHYAMDDVKGRGSTTKLNPKMIDKLGEAISKGHLPRLACASVNVGYETFLRWLKKGALDYERLVEMTEKGMSLVDQDYSLEYDLYEKIQEALYHSQDTPLETIKQASKCGDWRAAAHFLERRFPNEWGKRSEKIVDKRISGQVEVQTVVMVPNQASTMQEWTEAVEAYKNNELEYLPAAPDNDNDNKVNKEGANNLDMIEEQ